MCGTKTFIKILSQILFRYRQAELKLSIYEEEWQSNIGELWEEKTESY